MTRQDNLLESKFAVLEERIANIKEELESVKKENKDANSEIMKWAREQFQRIWDKLNTGKGGGGLFSGLVKVGG